MQTTDVDDDDEDGSDDVSVGSFLQVVCPLLRTYLSTVCPVEPEGSEEREAQGTIAAGSNERGEEDDDWDGEEIVWAEGAVNSQQDDSLATSSHTMVSIDLSNSPKAVDSAQVHAVAEKCLSKYRAVMLQHVLDPAVTPASLSLFGDGYIDQGAAGDDVCTHSDEGMTVSRKNSYALNTSVDCGEVDADLAIRLEYIFKRAEKGAVGTLRKHFPAYSMAEALQVLSPAFQVEREKYTKHSRERSLLYCEKVLREARAEVGLYYMQSDAHIEKGQAAEAINGEECKSEHSENVDTPTANGVSREEMAAKLTKVTEIYFANARGSAKQQVIAAFFADKLCGGESGQISEESDVQAENALLKEQIQQYQSTNARLKSRIESLVAENTQLHESVEDKTDKALDAWAALQEKYISLEMVLKAMKEETARKDEYISKLKSHVARVEQVNEAMKKGVAQILDEEDQTQSRHAPAQFSTSSFADLWSLALSCAIGAPLDDELSISENRHRASSSTGPGWISASTSSAKESSSTDRKTGSTE
ncbi:unnamed protein product [Symbiodinium microadriaticum]|nr:unnamed protein product [Symbiodinium microadriaticum]